VLLGEVDLAWGGERYIDEVQMTAVPLGDPMARGNWTLRPYRVSMYAAGGSPVVRGNPWTRGVELQGRALVRPWLAVVGYGGWQRGTIEEWNGALRADLVRSGAGVMLEQHTDRADLSVGGGVAGTWVAQSIQYVDSEGEDLDAESLFLQQLDPTLWVGAGAHVPVGPRLGLDAGVRTNLLYAFVNDSWTFEAEVQATAGLSVRFGKP
jgi:hypothetical protein